MNKIIKKFKLPIIIVSLGLVSVNFLPFTKMQKVAKTTLIDSFIIDDMLKKEGLEYSNIKKLDMNSIGFINENSYDKIQVFQLDSLDEDYYLILDDKNKTNVISVLNSDEQLVFGMIDDTIFNFD